MLLRESRKRGGAQRDNESGIAVAVAAIFALVLAGIAGLVFDGGWIYLERRQMQIATDAAAIGGAQEIWRSNDPLVQTAAFQDAALNGYDANSPQISLAVSHPPATGPRKDQTDFVEVVLTKNVSTAFMRLLGKASVPVRTRSVAGMFHFSEMCVLALDPTGSGALTVRGTADFNANCRVMANSTASEGLLVEGSACIDALWVGSAGTADDDDCVTPEPEELVPPFPDPLAYLAPPDPNAFPVVSNNALTINGGSVTLIPGRYIGGLKIKGGNVTLLPGLYIFDGLPPTGGPNGQRSALVIEGNAVVRGTGVTFYNTTTTGVSAAYGSYRVAGNVDIVVSAPTSGPYKGVLFYTDPTAPYVEPGHNFVGTASSRFHGAFYFPSTHVLYSGTNDSTSWTQLIAFRIEMAGTTFVNGPQATGDDVPTPVRTAAMYE